MRLGLAGPLRRRQPRHGDLGNRGRRRRRRQPNRRGSGGPPDRLPQHGPGQWHAGAVHGMFRVVPCADGLEGRPSASGPRGRRDQQLLVLRAGRGLRVQPGHPQGPDRESSRGRRRGGRRGGQRLFRLREHSVRARDLRCVHNDRSHGQRRSVSLFFEPRPGDGRRLLPVEARPVRSRPTRPDGGDRRLLSIGFHRHVRFGAARGGRYCAPVVRDPRSARRCRRNRARAGSGCGSVDIHSIDLAYPTPEERDHFCGGYSGLVVPNPIFGWGRLDVARAYLLLTVPKDSPREEPILPARQDSRKHVVRPRS